MQNDCSVSSPRFVYYRPQQSCGKVIFSQVSVSHSVHMGCLPDTPHPGQTPPWANPPGQTPPGQTPPRQTPHFPVHAGIHTPSAQWMLGYTPLPAATAADGTHPSGMHSCFTFNYYSSFTSWDDNQPNGSGDCMGYSESHNLFWEDFACENYSSSNLFVGFICEKDFVGTTTTTTPTTTTTTPGKL